MTHISGLVRVASMVKCHQLVHQPPRQVRHHKKCKFCWSVTAYNTGSHQLNACRTVAVVKTCTMSVPTFAGLQSLQVVPHQITKLVVAKLVTFVVKTTHLFSTRVATSDAVLELAHTIHQPRRAQLLASVRSDRSPIAKRKKQRTKANYIYEMITKIPNKLHFKSPFHQIFIIPLLVGTILRIKMNNVIANDSNNYK